MIFGLCPSHLLFCSWAELLSSTRHSSSVASSLLRKVVAQVVVYNIWQQRNNLLHNSVRLPPNIIFNSGGAKIFYHGANYIVIFLFFVQNIINIKSFIYRYIIVINPIMYRCFLKKKLDNNFRKIEIFVRDMSIVISIIISYFYFLYKMYGI